jgi:hypothetical protein
VYLARHAGLDRFVAIKRVNGAFALVADAHDRLRAEAQMLGRLDHANIVRVYDFARAGDDALIVMEYVEGESLAEVLARGEPQLDAALVVLADVAAALTHAHAHDVVHRDVKPSNVLVTKDGHAKLADFGLASQTGVVGTPGYMAPEQILGDASDARTDAYAYAAVAYEVLTDHPVFALDDRRALLDAHLLTQPAAPTEIVAGFPRAASDAIMRGLEKSPDDRLSVTEIARAIARTAQHEWPVIARTRRVAAEHIPVVPTEGNIDADDIVVVRHEEDSGGADDVLDVPVYEPRPAARSRARALAIGLAALAVIAIALIVIASRHDEGALGVRDVRVDVTPSTGRCPHALYTYTASIVGNGHAGRAHFRWRRPDGTRTDAQSVRVPENGPAHAELRFVIDGATATAVDASFELLSPTKQVVAAPPASFSCS